MKEFEGTKGEWRKVFINKTPYINSTYEIQFGYDGECVAEFVHDRDDAQLIATAPELLKALQGLLSIIDNSEGVHGLSSSKHLSFWEEFPEVEEAERVINKALGKDNK